MLLGILSDTHDNPEFLKKAIETFRKKKIGLAIHCGDWASPTIPRFYLKQKPAWKTLSVFGNNDGDRYRFLTYCNLESWNIEFFDEILEIELDGKKIAAYHGSSEAITDALVRCEKYDLVLTGHTHKPLIEQKGKTLHVNPGFLNPLGDHKDYEKASVAVYDTETGKAELVWLN
ncbi:MAG: metallophosphoesterase [Candidatus Aenigmarchaeota archaeon]|nr:metallophosphoesterase [Candidatus Aenigmarchaeota archaeon]